MKTNKFWSILMMFVLVLGAAFTFTSCGDDDDDDLAGDLDENTFVIDGVEYDADMAVYHKSESNGTYYFAVGNLASITGIEIESVKGMGAKCPCEKLSVVKINKSIGKLRNTEIYFVTDGNTFTVKFENLKFADPDHEGKEITVSLNYSGPAVFTDK